jgi:hypothetical protein
MGWSQDLALYASALGRVDVSYVVYVFPCPWFIHEAGRMGETRGKKREDLEFKRG